MAKLYVKTFGCQMNEYDSQKMADVLRESHSLELTNNAEQADVLLLNTCSIREKAQEKVFFPVGAMATVEKKQTQPCYRGWRLCGEPGRGKHYQTSPFC